MNMNGKHNIMYPEITVGDTVRIYQHNQLFDKKKGMYPNGPAKRIQLHLNLSLMGLFSIIQLLGKRGFLRHVLQKTL